mmetsp:Transcript_2148/g.9757  ORF Transcript_2148/g.9757 Transcript_2148/m.9757 type:complete len:211 (+) Transcript_2148:754-1386(+)
MSASFLSLASFVPSFFRHCVSKLASVFRLIAFSRRSSNHSLPSASTSATANPGSSVRSAPNPFPGLRLGGAHDFRSGLESGSSFFPNAIPMRGEPAVRDPGERMSGMPPPKRSEVPRASEARPGDELSRMAWTSLNVGYASGSSPETSSPTSSSSSAAARAASISSRRSSRSAASFVSSSSPYSPGSTAYGSTLTRISSFLRTNPPTAGP